MLFGAQHLDHPISSSVRTLWLRMMRYSVDCSKKYWYVHYVVLSLYIGSVGGVFIKFYMHHIDRIFSQWRRSITRNLAIVTNSWELLRNNWDLAVELVGYLRDNSEFVGTIVKYHSENWDFVRDCLNFISLSWWIR